MLHYLDQEGLIDGASPDEVMVSNGMISRFHFSNDGKMTSFEVVDRYGQILDLPDYGSHYSYRRNKVSPPPGSHRLQEEMEKMLQNQTTDDLRDWIRGHLPTWDFGTYHWVLDHLRLISTMESRISPSRIIQIFTYFIDYLRTMDTGGKAISSLIDITGTMLYEILDGLAQTDPVNWHKVDFQNSGITPAGEAGQQTLLIDAWGFGPEGTDPARSLAALLADAYQKGWRKFLLYRVSGQRLISTAVMGTGDTDEVDMDVYGTPGEYFAAFMQGGTIRLHGNAQNFCAMGMHHGRLLVFGNAGKVCGYASKGGEVFILGNIVDRAWTNSVNDPRCQDLKVHILGSASKYAGESLMGGDFFFGGMYFDSRGDLRIQERPYRGTKLLGGASRGNMLFFDPYQRMDSHQYTHGRINEITPDGWKYWQNMVKQTLEMAGIVIQKVGDQEVFTAEGKEFQLQPQNFKLIVPRGGLKGYESH